MEKINIEIIKQLIKEHKIRWTNHIVIRLLQRNISEDDIEIPVINKKPEEIDIQKIHDEIYKEAKDAYYTKDPFPSCLVYGLNLNGEVIHIVCGSNGNELWLITAYYPDTLEWEEDLKTRKEKNNGLFYL